MKANSHWPEKLAMINTGMLQTQSRKFAIVRLDDLKLRILRSHNFTLKLIYCLRVVRQVHSVCLGTLQVDNGQELAQ